MLALKRKHVRSISRKNRTGLEKRRQEFREKGEVARSRDVISVMILFSGVAYFMMFGRQIYIRMSKFLTRFFSLRLELEIEPEVMVNLFVEVLQLMAFHLSPPRWHCRRRLHFGEYGRLV